MEKSDEELFNLIDDAFDRQIEEDNDKKPDEEDITNNDYYYSVLESATFYVDSTNSEDAVAIYKGKRIPFKKFPSKALKKIMLDRDVKDVERYLDVDGRYQVRKHSYDPYIKVNSHTFSDPETGEPCFNTFEGPDKVYNRYNNVNMPSLYEPFFKHMFPIDEERERILDWISSTFYQKNNSYLCLVGKGGVGKGVLCELIMQGLHRARNYIKIGQKWFDDPSDPDGMDRCTLFYLDEINVSNKENHLSRLKELVNHQIGLRKLYIGNEVRPFYANILISSNDLSALNVELNGTERRYCVPKITDQSLLKADFIVNGWGGDLSRFIQEVSDKNNLEELWNFFQDRWQANPGLNRVKDLVLFNEDMMNDMLFYDVIPEVREVWKMMKISPGKTLDYDKHIRPAIKQEWKTDRVRQTSTVRKWLGQNNGKELFDKFFTEGESEYKSSGSSGKLTFIYRPFKNNAQRFHDKFENKKEEVKVEKKQEPEEELFTEGEVQQLQREAIAEAIKMERQKNKIGGIRNIAISKETKAKVIL